MDILVLFIFQHYLTSSDLLRGLLIITTDLITLSYLEKFIKYMGLFLELCICKTNTVLLCLISSPLFCDTESHYVSEADLEFKIFQPLLLECCMSYHHS